MSEPTFEQLRIPAALVLIILVAFIFLPRAERDDEPTTAIASPAATSSATAGQPGGAVTATVAPATPIPTLTPNPTPAPTATPTPAPIANTTFQAEVLACRSISGASCNGELGILPVQAATFTALVRFTDANAGDAIAVTLAGPGGTIAGGPFTLQGGGDGHYYSTFKVGGLPSGDYTLVATRNGSEVAQTSFRRR